MSYPGMPQTGSFYPERILLMCHGTKQMLDSTYKTILKQLKVPLTIEMVMRMKTIDIEPQVKPTVVANLAESLSQAQLEKLGAFELLVLSGPPIGVYITLSRMIIEAFFENTIKLLNVGGILVLKSTHFQNTEDIITFGKEVQNHYPSLTFSNNGNLIIFTKSDV